MRACWLKWVGRDWSISADYIWLNYSDANSSYMIRTTRRLNDGNLSRMLTDRIRFVLTAMVYFLMFPVEAQKMELMSAFIRQMAPRRKNGGSSASLNLLKTAPIVFLPLCRIKR